MMYVEEEWRPISGYPSYLVSSYGRVFNQYRRRFLRQFNTLGYLHVCLYRNGCSRTKKVHRLVADAFLERQESTDVVNHIDGDKTYNFVGNLEWCSQSANAKHAFSEGLRKATNKKKVRIIETGEIFDSLADCAEAIDGHVPTISRCLAGKKQNPSWIHF